jgi:hypothetical protein
MKPKRRICDRTGCLEPSTQHVTWPGRYETGYFACDRHARWWVYMTVGGRTEMAR